MKLTIKEFINYNNPCCICEENTTLNINCKSSNNFFIIKSYLYNYAIGADLLISYHNSLNILISFKDNTYHVNNTEEFFKYLKNKQLYLTLSCLSCASYIRTEYLEFGNKYVKPLSIYSEYFNIATDRYRVHIYTNDPNEDKSLIKIIGYDGNINEFTIPKFTKFKFKNKELLLRKIKTILNIS